MTQVILKYYHAVWVDPDLQLSNIFTDDIQINYKARDTGGSFNIAGLQNVLELYDMWTGYADRLNTHIKKFNMQYIGDSVWEVSYKISQKHFENNFKFEIIDTITVLNDKIYKIDALRLSKN